MSGPTEPDVDVDVGFDAPTGPTKEELDRSFDATAAAYELGRPEYPDWDVTTRPPTGRLRAQNA